VRATFEEHSADLGFACLLLRYIDDPRRRRNRSRRPPRTRSRRLAAVLGVPPHGRARLRLHRVMAYFFYRASFRGMRYPPLGALGLAVAIIPTPWIAAELGWFVAEFGRQPWTVDGVLPTALSASHLGAPTF
jgi:cytochrome d ubiquinol oxidase subunit I